MVVLAAIVLLAPPVTTGPHDPLTTPPEKLTYNGFYKKCAFFRGLPIISSEKVSDRAFHRILLCIGDDYSRHDG